MVLHRDPPSMAVRHEVEHRDHGGHHCLYLPALIAAFSAALFVLVFAVCVLWLVMSRQDSKLYEADNVVCVSQPLAVQCFRRTP
jgi:hypothetical protein